MPTPSPDWHPVTVFLDSAVAAGAAPGAVLAVLYPGGRFVHGTGQMGADDPAPTSDSTVYDLASLTKVVGLTTALMFAVQENRVELDAQVQRYVPAFAGAGKDRVTVRMLLAHASGLPAWRPLFRQTSDRAAAFALVDSTPLEVPPGTREKYSDLGAIVLTQLLESVFQERLDTLLERRLFQPLGMASTRFLPPPEWRPRIAPTEMQPWRGHVLRGEVHDENAAIMDGVSGHAGLFSSADDLLTFAEWLLDQAGGPGTRAAGAGGGQTVIQTNARTQEGIAGERPSDRPTIRPSVLAEFTRRQNLVPGSTRALGWDTPDPESSSGQFLSPSSFGHTGFTGTSLWLDPQHRLAIVLLSNRVNPTRDNPRWAP
ncbi:MAG TPA: serine hydrolase domain-containing protein, partial [Gemmatimonadales bacterium]